MVFCLCLLYISDDLSTSHSVCLYLGCLWTYLLDTNRGFPLFSLSFCVPSRSVSSRFQSLEISPGPSCLLLVMPHLASRPTTASVPFYLFKSSSITHGSSVLAIAMFLLFYIIFSELGLPRNSRARPSSSLQWSRVMVVSSFRRSENARPHFT